ncbi:hypothetical protein NQ318_007632 [Aromia moschata]|uniref:Uncharacterized protein n=1 Tax=Aromia moschata TaxID=1265417 RepID=A0AAV8YE28_9CUCU|nr:hypothetical protein NQ318_007632 [Aromia moschata]
MQRLLYKEMWIFRALHFNLFRINVTREMLMFWVTDNFLMYKDPAKKKAKQFGRKSPAQGESKISLPAKKKRRESESDILLSADDELLDPETVPIARAVLA